MSEIQNTNAEIKVLPNIAENKQSITEALKTQQCKVDENISQCKEGKDISIKLQENFMQFLENKEIATNFLNLINPNIKPLFKKDKAQETQLS